MKVIGYDPEITVEAAWSLPSTVKKAHHLGEVLKHSDFVTLHVPLLDATRNMIDAAGVAQMRSGAVLLNFSRGGVVDEAAVLEALEAKRLGHYVCDFPAPHLLGRGGVIVLPHLGASTREAEENCAIMVADQVRDYLLDGTITNAVNFPDVAMPRESPYRIAIANANVPNMVAQVSHEMAAARSQHLDHDEQVARRDRVHPGRRRQRRPESVIDAIAASRRSAEGQVPAGRRLISRPTGWVTCTFSSLYAHGFARVAACTADVYIADPARNARERRRRQPAAVASPGSRSRCFPSWR